MCLKPTKVEKVIKEEKYKHKEPKLNPFKIFVSSRFYSWVIFSVEMITFSVIITIIITVTDS